MGVQELPDNEPNPLQYATVGAYVKAYVDWLLARQQADIERRLKALEKASEVVR